ncbi:hypothetical protein V9L05_22210 (plasmid) [Bernardetia sp. Wsw4-3y2]|uniref:hypothetical protein n=1 Tax=Bernardetia sp. Wsw4-3y2 TaxID=3127471 RepID=UPI0030D2BD0A
MKHIVKIYLLNPILPTFFLLVFFCWIGYDNFLKEKYTDAEKKIWNSATNNVRNLGNTLLENTNRLSNDLKYQSSYEYCLNQDKIPPINSELVKHLRELINENFVQNDFSNPKEIPIRFVFESYVKKASELDTALAKKYKDFEFENGLSDKEINLNYFSYDSMQSKYHLARFEMQLAEMYSDDMKLLANIYFLNELKEKLSNPVIVPYIKNHNKGVDIYTVYPFDTEHTKIESPKGLETHFDDRGYLIIPPSLRGKKIDMDIRIKCSADTTYTYKNYHEE